MKREWFFAQVYFSNKTVSQTTVSTGQIKMFRLEQETMNVCQRNVARFGVHVECRFDKINYIFQRKARVMFCVMKLGRYAIVDDGGNYVTFRELNVHINNYFSQR